MVMMGETICYGGRDCDTCGGYMLLQVCKSAAGYYLGFHCPQCGPYSRETKYYETKEEAQNVLSNFRGFEQT